ncbi:MAG TPA: phosphatase PAP2 family protein [Pirellulales bacterium]
MIESPAGQPVVSGESAGTDVPHRVAVTSEELGPARGLAGARAYRWPWVSVLLVVLGCAAFSADLPTTEFCLDREADNIPGGIEKLLDVAEVFGNGIGVTIILGAVLLLDPCVWPFAPRLIAASLGSGISSNIGKLLIARTRPVEFRKFHDLDTASVWETFDGWLPLFQNTARTQGFPSSHTATAFGLAIVLAWRYPRGRVLFFALAVLVGLQRVSVGMHFLSDVCFGAALGWTIGSLCVHGPYPARWFDRFESRRAAARATVTPCE